jgi:NAD(P)-dependent dehydrogenase (short-subunit alcohol dehydrogenase family)
MGDRADPGSRRRGSDGAVTPRVDRILQGKVVLVSGGGAGIGRAVCISCAEAGADVLVAAPADNGRDTAEAAEALGVSSLYVRTNVASAFEVQSAVDAALSHFGRLDAVVHSATSRHSSEVHTIGELTDELWDDHVSVSLRGAFHLARSSFPSLAETKGRFVLMTSPAGMEGSATLPAYAAVKGALRGLAKSLAIEWGPFGVTVACVSPLAKTPSLEKAYAENPALESRLLELVPLGRIGDAEADIAPVVRFLVEDGSRYLTGQTVVVDGGRFTTL